MTCPNCGTDNSPNFHFCHNCGVEFNLPAASLNSTPDTTIRPERRPRNNTPFIVATSVIALMCICACGLFFVWIYLAQGNDASAQGAPRATSTRRPTATALAETTQEQTLKSNPTATLATTSFTNSTPTAARSSSTFSKWKASQVESIFHTLKLEFENPHPMSNEEFGTIPHIAQESIRFYLPSLGGQKGGHLYTFSNLNDLKKMETYYTSGQSGAAIKPILLVKDNVLIQFTGELPQVRVDQYQTGLNAIR